MLSRNVKKKLTGSTSSVACDMKNLFFGSILGNNGPSNVNKGIVCNLTSNFWYAKSKNKYMHMAEAVIKSLFSDVVVISGVSKQGMLLMKFVKLARKKLLLSCMAVRHMKWL